MRGNSHVRFLGGGVVVTPSCYPTKSANTQAGNMPDKGESFGHHQETDGGALASPRRKAGFFPAHRTVC